MWQHVCTVYSVYMYTLYTVLLDLRCRTPAYHISQLFHPVSHVWWAGHLAKTCTGPSTFQRKELLAVKSVPAQGPTQEHIMSGKLWPQVQPCPVLSQPGLAVIWGAPPIPVWPDHFCCPKSTVWHIIQKAIRMILSTIHNTTQNTAPEHPRPQAWATEPQSSLRPLQLSPMYHLKRHLLS